MLQFVWTKYSTFSYDQASTQNMELQQHAKGTSSSLLMARLQVLCELALLGMESDRAFPTLQLSPAASPCEAATEPSGLSTGDI